MGRCEIAQSVAQALITHARVAAPAECCGVLIGRHADVIDAVPAFNLSHEPTRYLLDPETHFRARRVAARLGLDVVGFYHSHPQSMPTPSETDVAEASYPEAIYLIVGLAEREPRLGAYRLGSGGYQSLPIEILPARVDPTYSGKSLGPG